MRLCFATPEYVTEPRFSGGLANYLGRVTVALAQRGHEVHVLTRASEPGTMTFHGVHVHRVVPLWDRRMILDHIDPRIPRRYYNVYQDFKAAWSIYRYWRKLRRTVLFDLVQVANVQAVGLFFRFEKRVPVVIRLSSYRPTWDTLAGMHNVPGARLRWAMERQTVEGIAFVCAPSHYIAGEVERHYRVRQVEVVETPFFPEVVAPDPAVLEHVCGASPFVLFFGRMTQMKGVHVLVEALEKVLPRRPDMHAVFIGGEGPAPDGTGMKSYIANRLAPFADRVHVLNPLRHEQLYPFVSGARVVAIPSLADNLPNTCLEAMGLGRPVIATTGSCFEQLIDDGVSGVLVPASDAEALASGIEQLWTMDDAARQAIGERAKQRIDQLHPDVAIPRLIAYYESVKERFEQRHEAI